MNKKIAVVTALTFLCNAIPAAAIARTPTRFQPLSAETCNQLRSQVSKILKVNVKLDRASFQDYINGGEGTGCQLTATGNGTTFASVDSVARSVRTMLKQQGWREDSQYAADGPTGRGTGFRKGNSLSLFLVEWEPAPGADCPEDRIISDCDFSPEQQLYRIVLNSARR